MVPPTRARWARPLGLGFQPPPASHDGKKTKYRYCLKTGIFFSLGPSEAEPLNYSPEPFSTYAQQLKVTSP